MSVDTSPEWKPKLIEPHAAIIGFEDLGFKLGDGEDRRHRGIALNRLLIEHANEDLYEPPAFEPDPDSQTTQMRYTGPNFFRLAHLLEDVATLRQAYRNIIPDIWSQEFGDAVAGVRPLPEDGRPADAFITNSEQGENTDWHVDGWLTAAGYAAPGAGLVIAHCVNPREGLNDLRGQHTTLVVPRPGSFVLFLGTQHPHRGTTLNISTGQSPDERLEKWDTLQANYNVQRVIHNFGNGEVAQNLGELAAWEELNGERVVMTLNFATDDVGSSKFDQILGGS